VDTSVDDRQLGVGVGEVGGLRVPLHVVDVCADIPSGGGVFQGVSGGKDLLDSDCCRLLPLLLKEVIPKLDIARSEGFLFKTGQGVGIPFHGGTSEALCEVGLDFLFATDTDSILDAVDEVVDVAGVGIGAYLDDISFTLCFVESRTEEADFLRGELGGGACGSDAGWTLVSRWALWALWTLWASGHRLAL
jgi:hypothetical protein